MSTKKYIKHDWQLVSPVSEQELEKDWRKLHENKGKVCLTTTFYCVYSKSRGSCPALLKRQIFDSENANVRRVEFRSNQRDHENHREDYYGLTPEQKTFVLDLFRVNISKPSEIIRLFRLEGKLEPEKSKLKNFLHTLREKDTPTFSLSDIKEWCMNNICIPDSEDDVFVPNFSIEGTTEEDFVFHVTLSTKRLLRIAPQYDILCADATYKTNWHGFPVLISGVVDREKKFHPTMFMISKNETSGDFKFLFGSLKTAVEGLTSSTYCPKYLLSDCADSITNGFIEVFGGNMTRIYCWAHCKRAYSKKLDSVEDKAVRAQLDKEIDCLQLCSSPHIFNKMSSLWLEKYKNACENVKEFVFNYFEKQWLKKNSGWYEGIAVGYPSTNNALERFNRSVKDEMTHKERRPLGEFMQLGARAIKNWSVDRSRSSPNMKTLAKEPKIDKKMRGQAYNWSTKYPDFNIATHASLQWGFVKSKQSLIKNKTVKKYACVDYIEKIKTFDEFLFFQTNMRVVTLPCAEAVKPSILDASCTCSYFLKDYLCQHTLVLCSQVKIYKFPEAMEGLLVQKPKRGRPSKTRKALEKQD